MAGRKPTGAETAFLLLFHATISGAFLVAYFTGDEDSYGMHVFSGYAVIVALTARLLAGLLAAGGSPLRLPRPSAAAVGTYLRRIRETGLAAFAQRSPLLAWMAVALLIGVGAAAITGAVADFTTAVEDLHEALGEAALYIVIAHVALVLCLHVLKPSAPGRAPGGNALRGPQAG